MTACSQCGADVENTAVTGIFCASCYAADVAPQPEWRAYLTPPATFGLVVLGLGHAIEFQVNGLSYTAAGAGAVGMLAGIMGVATAGKMMPEWKTKQMAMSAGVATLGALSLATSGIVGLI